MRESLGYAPGETDERWTLEELEALEDAVGYRASAWQCLSRLQVRGKSLDRAREAYEDARQEILSVFARDRTLLGQEGVDRGALSIGDPLTYDLETRWLEGSESLYENLDFDYWLRALKEYVERARWEPGPHSILKSPHQVPTEVEYISKCYRPERFMGFLVEDDLLLLVCLLSVVDPQAPVELDLTELRDNGYLEEDEEVVSAEPHFTVLTEGKSDKWILERSLAFLYPHLAPYYRFADFEASGLAGGIHNNIQVIKTFIALSIRDQLIVLFDNDAVGNGAIQKLASDPIPPNVKVMALPNIDRARNYPTLGPEGLKYGDVNGQAVSIEFFLGWSTVDSPPPVRWKAFQPETGLYQGEIERKTLLQQNFNRVLSSLDLSRAHDWTDMHILLQAIFRAFA